MEPSDAEKRGLGLVHRQKNRDPVIHFRTCVFVCLSTVYVAPSIGKKNTDAVTIHTFATYVLATRSNSSIRVVLTTNDDDDDNDDDNQ